MEIGKDFEIANQRIHRLESQARELREKLTDLKIKEIEINDQIELMIKDLDMVLNN